MHYSTLPLLLTSNRSHIYNMVIYNLIIKLFTFYTCTNLYEISIKYLQTINFFTITFWTLIFGEENTRGQTEN